MATATTVDSHEHGHDDHGHGEFIQHHFESAEQQFDSGKLGMWLFIAQEILFFSGLFVAYTMLRYHHPEIFNEAYVYLNKYLGGINTIVLLFSSLTMAIAVRCSQVEQRGGTVWCIIITMACAAIFLGVKAVEYSHKWHQGLFWAGIFGNHYDIDYLLMLCIPFGIGLVVSILGAVFYAVNKDKAWMMLFVGLTITFAAYFAGVAGGQVIESLSTSHVEHGAGDHDSHAVPAHGDGHDHQGEKGHHDEGEDKHASAAQLILHADTAASENATEAAKTEQAGEHEASPATSETPAGSQDAEHPVETLNPKLGMFFSIYYIMTGLHALHILAGIVVLAWILYRAAASHFRKDYFGPVENVGLYWHLVDLIWIYLFPLMYLIH